MFQEHFKIRMLQEYFKIRVLQEHSRTSHLLLRCGLVYSLRVQSSSPVIILCHPSEDPVIARMGVERHPLPLVTLAPVPLHRNAAHIPQLLTHSFSASLNRSMFQNLL